MTIHVHIPTRRLTLEQAPPAACPPVRSTRRYIVPPETPLAEDWGVARFEVIEQARSAHQIG